MWIDRQPAQRAFVAMIEVLQPMQVVQVPRDRGVLALISKVYSALWPRA
jgi:hypothetical protein